ncbi:MAG: winged helix-turn-helix transcriptional regulator, partial [Verrucomicrobia bacterium]|nr:winged helix-turn-helix transcriptional regulator [Verrucomicrobiota bacterium]
MFPGALTGIFNFTRSRLAYPPCNRQRKRRETLWTRNALDQLEHTSESVLMHSVAPLQPTLWRTCRAIANRTRLQMFHLLLQQPGQTVSAVANQMRQPLSLASKYLRALEARGLLTAHRTGRWVEYRPSPATSPSVTAGLVAALRATFQRQPKPVETIFRLATAFTHPRRIEIFRVLQAGPCDLGQLRAATGISAWALLRHLKKLEARGFVTQRGSLYALVHR